MDINSTGLYGNRRTRGHDMKLFVQQSRIDVCKYFFH